jgi:hypothetical protein
MPNSAKTFLAQLETELSKATTLLSDAAGEVKALEPLLEAVKGIKLSNKVQLITVEATAGPEVFDAAFKNLFLARLR